MKPASSKARPKGREPARDDARAEGGDSKTPDSDIQPEDTASAGAVGADRGTAAESAMKQTSKTGNESGRRR